MNESNKQFGLGLKYKVLYIDGSSCDFIFVGGQTPLVEITRNAASNDKVQVPLEKVLNNYVSVTEIK